MSRMKKAIVIMSVIVTIGCIISIGGAYAATSYAISATKIGYSDNSNLGVDNVQAAIDGTCSRIDNRLSNLEQISEQHKLTYVSNSNYKLNGINGDHSYWYQVGKLVIVNIALGVTTPSTTSTVPVVKDLPKPKYMMNYISITAEQPVAASAVGVVDADGTLKVMGGTAGYLLDGQVVYVAA